MGYVAVSEQTRHMKGDRFRVTVKIPAPYTDVVKNLIETGFRVYKFTQPKLEIERFETLPPEHKVGVGQNPPWSLVVYYKCLEDF
jgi:hypothetical protein